MPATPGPATTSFLLNHRIGAAPEVVMSSIARLADREFNGLLRRRIPHALDDVVERVVADYRSAPPTQRRDMLGEVQPRIADVLSAYGERMAAVAVRQSSTEPLRRGLVAMGMAEGALTDPRNNLLVLAAMNH